MKGIQFQPIRLDADLPGALAANTSLILNTQSGFSQSYLLKQVQYLVNWSLPQAIGDSLIIGLCNGTATVAEITAALTTLFTDVDDATSPGISAQKQIILWETLHMFGNQEAAVVGADPLNRTISIGGGGGIPLKEATGVSVFVYNPGTAGLTAGSALVGLVILKGIWLND